MSVVNRVLFLDIPILDASLVNRVWFETRPQRTGDGEVFVYEIGINPLLCFYLTVLLFFIAMFH